MAKKDKTAAQPVTASREEVIKTILAAVEKNIVLQHEGKPLTAFMALSLTVEKISKQLININTLVEAVKNVNMTMLTCPNTACEAPVLLEMGNCPVCSTELMSTGPAPKEVKAEVVKEAPASENQTQEAAEVKPVKAKKIEKTKEDKPLPTPKVEKDAPLKTAKQRNEETLLVPKDQDSAGSIPTVPSEKEIDAMDVAGLRAFYKELGLPVDEKAHGIKKVGELRQLVKSVLAKWLEEKKAELEKVQKAEAKKAKADKPAKAEKETKPAKAGKKEKKNKYEKEDEDESTLDEDLDLEETLGDSEEDEEDTGDFDDMDFEDDGVEEIEEEEETEEDDEDFDINLDDVEEDADDEDSDDGFDDDEFEDED